MFSGRIYEHMPRDPNYDVALADFRRCSSGTAPTTSEGLYSVPIGSRFHPERAPLWNSTLTDVDSTEQLAPRGRTRPPAEPEPMT